MRVIIDIFHKQPINQIIDHHKCNDKIAASIAERPCRFSEEHTINQYAAEPHNRARCAKRARRAVHQQKRQQAASKS